MTTIEKIRARERDPDLFARAQLVSDKIYAKIDPQRVRLFGKLAHALPNPVDKINILRKLASDMRDATRNLVPCANGCSSCCSMDTLISVEEADVIAREIGIAAATPTKFFDGAIKALEYEGVPCTFLKNNQCTIYASRPFACRMHVTVDSDNLLCQIIPGESIILPRFDSIAFDFAYSNAFGSPLTVRLADIRAFFPGAS